MQARYLFKEHGKKALYFSYQEKPAKTSISYFQFFLPSQISTRQSRCIYDPRNDII